MMKFNAIILLALVGCALAYPTVENFDEEKDLEANEVESDLELTSPKPSLFALFPADNAETSKIKPEFKPFEGFCLDSRDEARAYLMEGINANAAKLFNLFFNSISEITQEMLDAQRQETARSVANIKAGIAPPTTTTTTDATVAVSDEYDVEAAKSDEPLPEPGTTSIIGRYFKGVMVTALNAATTGAKQRIEALKLAFKGENVRQVVEDTCRDLSSNLELRLESRFADYKSSIDQSAYQMETVRLLERARPNELGCITAGRVYALTKVCRVMSLVGNTIWPMLLA